MNHLWARFVRDKRTGRPVACRHNLLFRVIVAPIGRQQRKKEHKAEATQRDPVNVMMADDM
jgi:hypothetical protein